MTFEQLNEQRSLKGLPLLTLEQYHALERKIRAEHAPEVEDDDFCTSSFLTGVMAAETFGSLLGSDPGFSDSGTSGSDFSGGGGDFGGGGADGSF